MSLILVAGPAVEPLTAAEAKARLNIGDEVSDDVMKALISASRNMIDGRDGWLGRVLITQTWDMVLDRFPTSNYYYQEKGFYPQEVWYPYPQELWGMYPATSKKRHGITIPLPPLQQVVSVTYTDVNGAPQTLDPATYIVNKDAPSDLSLVSGASWPSAALTPGAVVVRFIAGYGDKGSDVPEDIRMGITLQASHFRSLTERNLFLSRETVPGILDRGWTMGGGAESALNGAVQSLLNSYRVWM
jgi:uncharacterized phiE125 gp8 family phage protein